jgi:glyoxylase-like metal-dependent hydrolase (beta-lactamase superfamily II)
MEEDVTSEIRIITVPFIFNVSVNCYLVNAGDGFILIDTGRDKKRQNIERELKKAGCKRGNLKLILLTHGDFDHSANAAYFREKFDTKIAMHFDDAGMVERGDMTWNRNRPNIFIRTLFGLLIKLRESDRFTPDFYIEDGDDLSEYGFEAEVLSIPGHSKGSVGFLAAEGDLFCGDLLANTDKPAVWSIIDDAEAANASVEKLKRFDIKTVYPGHGEQFPMEAFIKNYP